MQIATTMKEKLTRELAPVRLDIVDDSHRHAGHSGSHPQGESHFTVTVVSAAFEGRSRVDRQRMVYGALAEELAGRVHALSLKTLTPAEDA